MKKILVSAILMGASSVALADAAGGPNCGWGNMLLEGSTGLGPHLSATFINGTSGNATFGMTLGTNGCSVDGALTYGGDKMVWFDQILDEYSTDVATGDGEALKAVAVMFGVEPEHRQHFGDVMHENFTTLFPSQDVTSQEVLDSMLGVMQADKTLAMYVG
jgi:hypothetical protein